MLESSSVSDPPSAEWSEPVRMRGWALILGASSGFGEAVSLALARAGLDIFGVHLDRKATLPNAERIAGEIRALGRRAVFFNVNAADADRRAETAAAMRRVLEERGEVGAVRVLLHSLAFGTLKRYVAEVTGGEFPKPENWFGMKDAEFEELKKLLE